MISLLCCPAAINRFPLQFKQRTVVPARTRNENVGDGDVDSEEEEEDKEDDGNQTNKYLLIDLISSMEKFRSMMFFSFSLVTKMKD